ncbi:type VI secretion system tip protein VgrG [Luteimonas yindakuii]|uniref:type VI secretion system Vgr family protein n=1 Tax=Luteimonas yindakuii TaxID=2565782 RepID=UPI00110797A9|nr:type VI secretion system Vgr family protein [Luteimonas yindakuii]QCU72614.1 type VI secretion system tip protein VgrG [Luteimonas yindakuii]
MDAAATLTALLAAPGQHDRLLRLHTPLGPDVLVVEAFHGSERVGDGGFRFEITALSVDAHLDLDALLGRPVLLELLTAESRSVLRPFHGHVTAFEQLGSNGGLARYRLGVEPWLAFLRQRVDSYVFQGMTLVQIVEDVFADYVDAGALAPAWRWDLQDPAVYPVRSLTTQYQESDFAFIERLLADEGLFYWFEHAGAPGSDTLGRHTLVIADHNEACTGLGSVRYHRADATERGDSVQAWSPARRLHAARIARASWDYRSLGMRPATAEDDAAFGDAFAEDLDTAGPYAWCDASHGERLARRQIEGARAAARTGSGKGTWRRMAPGMRFSVTQHPQAGDGLQLCLGVDHAARNNLGADVLDALEQSLGPVALPGLDLPEHLGGPLRALRAPSADLAAPPQRSDPCVREEGRRTDGHGPGGGASAGFNAAPDDFYRNTFIMLPADITYRPCTLDHGGRIHPRPTVHGTQSAIVVSDDAPLTTDRDHRIKVQFPWQRGGDASAVLAHPGGEDNAPGDDSAWTWVRVATPWAGDNWGGVVVPRKGQEVLVAFLEGDIDRPVVVGSVYNGRGQPDAPRNSVSGGGAGATGNAAAWFDGNDHAAVYTGFKSQALASSQQGTGGYQLLRFDDTPGQGRAQAATTQHATTLTLGHLKGGEDNVREIERGFGAELSTQANGAIRAGSGLLLTAEPGQQQLAARQALGQLAASAELTTALAETSTNQQAGLPDEPAPLAVQRRQETLQGNLMAAQHGNDASTGGDVRIGGGEGQAPGWSAPHMLAAGADGVMALTPAGQAWVSGTQTAMVAGTDLDWMSQASHVTAVAGGIALFAQGGDPPNGKPNRETGIALHAAQGTVSVRAHRNVAKVAAKTKITVASTQADVEIAAPARHVLLTAQGAYLKIEGDNIELGAPGVVEFKASIRELTGPKSFTSELPPLSQSEFCVPCFFAAARWGGALVPA